MRNASIADLDSHSWEVLPIGTQYPPDTVLPYHRHRRAQLLYGSTGVMQVDTQDGSWTVPTHQAVLIPAEVEHLVRFIDVTTWSLYIEPTSVPWWPNRCTVITVSPLLRELLQTADTFEITEMTSPHQHHVFALLLLELQHASAVPLEVPLPRDSKLRALCTHYLAAPELSVSNQDWARDLMLSQRSLDRTFKDQTGMSPAAWRTRARVLVGLRLLRTQTITQISEGMGYASPAAFTAAFSREIGRVPSSFQQHSTARRTARLSRSGARS
ncbi:AraC family transcriptional regulator [Brevibacterium sp. FME37]|uniref:AraC family transcriptional regulator n=1 Tax=Brevibacterium sp. FME37 TaxID=2742607 RepID=UPI0018684FD2|nr:helix-turn-helix transcriptional regulator [Brevibacterium sp. FME37]